MRRRDFLSPRSACFAPPPPPVWAAALAGGDPRYALLRRERRTYAAVAMDMAVRTTSPAISFVLVPSGMMVAVFACEAPENLIAHFEF